jgi:outer membrane protein
MKKLLSLPICGAVCLLLIIASQAQAEMKIATIDMQKVFMAYYKTHELEEKLKEAQKAYKDELDGRMDAYKKNLDLINQLNEDLKSRELSDALKDQKAGERDGKIAETKGLEKEISDFRQTREQEIQEQLKRMRDTIVGEIMIVVEEQVKTANYDMVFDRSGFSSNNLVPVMLYARESYDFSDSVITKLNAGKTEGAVPLSQRPVDSSNTAATSSRPSSETGRKSH